LTIKSFTFCTDGAIVSGMLCVPGQREAGLAPPFGLVSLHQMVMRGPLKPVGPISCL
jgi:hypothetical protein